MPSQLDVDKIRHTNGTDALTFDTSGNTNLQKDLKFSSTAAIKNSAGNNILSESGGTITLTTNSAVIEGSSSGDLVRITQTGNGNALVVEDETNPDSTPFVVDASGNVGVGVSNPIGKLTVEQSGNTSQASIGIRSINSANDTYIGMGYDSSSDSCRITASYVSTGAFKPISFFTSDTERMRIDSSGNLNLNGGGEFQKNGTTGRIITYGDVTVNGLTTSYQNIKITLPNSITHNQVVSIIPHQGVINDIVYIAEIALGVWSGIQTTNEARLSIRLGNAAASSDGIVRVWYIL